MDVLHMLLAEDCTCLLKMNPVNDYQGPVVERLLAPLVAGGYVQLVYGGAAVGKHVVHHPDVARVHLTGGWWGLDV